MTHTVRELPVAIDLRSLLPDLDACEHVVLVENSAVPEDRDRWAFLATDPAQVFRSERGRCWAGPPGGERSCTGTPLEVLAGLLRMRRRQQSGAGPPWRSGAAGYLGYGLLHEIENVADRLGPEPGRADCYLGLFDAVAATDLLARRSWVAGCDTGACDRLAERIGAGRPLEETRPQHRAAPRPRRRVAPADLARAGVRPVVDPDSYLARIEVIGAHLLAGNCYEVCLTQRFDTDHGGDAIALYDALCRASPAPHAAFVRVPGVEVACASPELFLRADPAGAVETRPIKGTRPRGRTPHEDEALAAELAASPKDAAENLMIVDLSRNDLGRVCEYGSVRVPELARVETHAHTHQLVSTITGRLRPEVGPIDVIRAAFPGGSMTGAPKVAAMSIIDALEPVPRGPYSGSIGWIDDSGALDLNIVIRSLVKTGDHVSFHTGGAIVADSDPAAEYQETLDKAAGMLAALEPAGLGGGAPGIPGRPNVLK